MANQIHFDASMARFLPGIGPFSPGTAKGTARFIGFGESVTKPAGHRGGDRIGIMTLCEASRPGCRVFDRARLLDPRIDLRHGLFDCPRVHRSEEITEVGKLDIQRQVEIVRFVRGPRGGA